MRALQPPCGFVQVLPPDTRQRPDNSEAVADDASLFGMSRQQWVRLGCCGYDKDDGGRGGVRAAR
jgi:hypothetical protein